MAKIRTLSCDIETFSSVDLAKCGVYRYCESPDFEILLFAYSVNEEPVRVVDVICGEEVPVEVLAALTDDAVEKWAYNAQYERVCLSYWLRQNHPEHFASYGIPEDSVGGYLDPTGWKCTRIWGAYMGLPLSLKGVGAVLKLDEQKMEEGADLIKYFCKPCRPTKKNGGRTRNLPHHDPAKWALFKKYNARDVEVELAIKARLAKFPVPDFVWDEYHLDQEINDRGILVDVKLVEQAIVIDAKTKQALRSRMRETTGLENPNSVTQMKDWLSGKGIEAESLDKKAVKELLTDAGEDVADVLSCRQQLAKASVSKYRAMQNAVCADGRARGMFSFYGANRTGRWCLTGDHEVLTPEGWRRLDEWSGGTIACWSPTTETITFQTAESVSFDYDGPMYTYRDGKIDQCSTPDHKMYAQESSGGSWRDMTVEEMSHCHPCIWISPGHSHEICVKPIITAFTGKVYCACTQTGYFLVRRGGKVWVTGNSGKLIQLQNLPQNHMDDLAEARNLVRDGNFEALELIYDNTPNVLSELIRTAFVPKPGYKYIVSDFSAIEARVLSFLAGEQWRIDLFKNGGDIYCQSASRMFGVPVEKHGVNSHLRQKGKIAELACIAEGQLVLTDTGLVPIEQVTTNMKLWDGEDWVSHDGVIYKGERDVIEYEGLTATPDHLVWVAGKSEPIRFGLAVASGAHLVQTGHGRSAIRLGENHQSRKALESWNHQRKGRLFDIQNAGRHHRFTVSGCLVHNCGYGGGVGALKAMGAIEMGLTEDELQPLVTSWRDANPRITRFWWDVDAAVKKAVMYKTSVESHGFRFYYQSGMLFIDLPSGRRLSYVKPRIGMNRFGSESVTYEGINLGKWTRLETYGPKVTENLVQAVSRDILAYAMKTLRHCFIVGSVHDELIIECSPDVSLQAVCDQMGRTPPWIEGLLLRADGYECQFYMKS